MNTNKQPVITSRKTFTQADFDLFARISGDNNPIHVDPEFSAHSRFGRRVSHGMLLYTYIWGQIKTHYPAAVHESQYLMFPAPTYADEEMQVEIFEEPYRAGENTSVQSTAEQIAVEKKVLKASLSRVADDVVTCLAETTVSLGKDKVENERLKP